MQTFISQSRQLGAILFFSTAAAGIGILSASESPSLQIVELWVAPDEGPEWIEVENISAKDLPYSEVILRRNNSSCRLAHSLQIQSGERLVLTADSSNFRERYGYARIRLAQPSCWLALPNNGGGIALTSPKGEMIDSVSWAATPKEIALHRTPESHPGTMERWPPGGQATPGYTAPWIKKNDTLVVLHRPKRGGDGLVMQLLVQEGKKIKWQLLKSNGKSIRAGELKGASEKRVIVEMPRQEWTPLWLYWCISPDGKCGNESLLLESQ